MPGDVVSFSCDSGYEIAGKDSRTCRIDGAWSGPPPNCKSIKCRAPNEILHGKYLGDSREFGSKIDYICDEGYQLDGPTQRTCNGNWTGSEPRCNALLCPDPPIVEHGMYDGDARQVGVVISVTCHEGYELAEDNHQTITCQKDQTWTKPLPACQKITCDKPSFVISNGRMIDTDFSFNATIRYVCDEGYHIDGPTTRVCGADGQWRNTIPVCERVECPKPMRPPNSFVEGFKYKFQEKVTYNCKDGYRLVGPEIRVCQSNGTWSGPEPECKQVQCPSPSDPQNGRVVAQGLLYTNTLRYECERGYKLEGDETRECLANGTWSGVLPSCSATHCGPPPTIDGGESMQENTDIGSAPKYRCKLGLMLMDSVPGITCTKHGNYSGSLPNCVEVECPEPGRRGIRCKMG